MVYGYAVAARALGVAIERECEVTGITTSGGRIELVETNKGVIRTHAVVCAAGAWSSQVGAMAGVTLPITPLRREIMVTEPLPVRPRGLPMTIDFTSTLYFHEEGPGMLIGMADPEETPGFKLEPSEEWLLHLGDRVAQRIPWLLDTGVHAHWAGVYEVTPDNNALIGAATGVEQFFYASGFSGHGFLQAPAVGEVIRDLYLGVQPVIDVTPLHADRFAAGARRPETHCV